MSFFDRLLGRFRAVREMSSFWNMFTAYTPRFRVWDKKLYEMDSVRAAIDAFARHVSKLNIRIDGSAQPKMQTLLKKRPNTVMTWSQFLYRTATILEVQNTVVIVPMFNRSLEVVGIWPVLPSRCKILQDKKETYWLEYKFSDNSTGAVELNRCGILTKFQYDDDLLGSTNEALDDLMDVAFVQRQGIREGIKSAGTFRFIARSTNWKDPDDLAQEQKNFSVRHMSADKSGFLLFPNVYDNIQHIQSKAYLISAEDQKYIKETVDDYFGTNEEIIQNKATAAQMDAFFDGKIEPFAIQLEQVMTRMFFNDNEIGYGAKVRVEANRLQYMSTGDKINFISALSDRGLITINEARELLNYSPLPDGQGDLLPIRAEYNFLGADETMTPDKPAEEDENGDQE